MQVDIQFDFATVYNIDKRVDVEKGQKFSLLTDLTGGAKWFSDNDPVLNITVDGGNAKVDATGIGESTVLIMGTDFGIQKTLVFNVVDSNMASALNATADEAVSK